MKTAVTSGLVALAFLCGCHKGHDQAAASGMSTILPETQLVQGRWSGTYSRRYAGSVPATLSLSQIGGGVAGTITDSSGAVSRFTGALDGDAIAFTLATDSLGCAGSVQGRAVIDGDLMSINSIGTDCQGTLMISGTFKKVS